MSDTKFTKGNWHWREDEWNGGWSGLYSDNDTPVLEPQSCNEGNDGAAWFATVDDAGEEGLTDADRALIAAAPELYEALSLVLAHLPDPQCAIWRDVQSRAMQALAKAKGEDE